METNKYIKGQKVNVIEDGEVIEHGTIHNIFPPSPDDTQKYYRYEVYTSRNTISLFREYDLVPRVESGGIASVKLMDIDIVRSDGTITLKLYGNDEDTPVALVKADAIKMQEFALRILQQTTYALDKL